MTEQKRRAKRQPVMVDGMVYAISGVRIAPCRLRNVSETGAQIELQRETVLPASFLLTLSVNGQVQRRCSLVWQFSTVAGVKFTDRQIPGA
jgi:hypothetical protein